MMHRIVHALPIILFRSRPEQVYLAHTEFTTQLDISRVVWVIRLQCDRARAAGGFRPSPTGGGID